MTKTIVLDVDLHRNLKKIQAILYEKYDIEMHLRDILLYVTDKAGIQYHDTIAKEIAEFEKDMIGQESIRNESIRQDTLNIETPAIIHIPIIPG